jgi:hypothetical protein
MTSHKSMDGIKMKKIVFLIASIVAIAVVGVSLLSTLSTIQTYEGNNLQSQVYVPSDMSKAFPNYTLAANHFSMTTTDITKVKDEIKYTVAGTVTKISDPIIWIDPTPHDTDVVDSLGDRIKIDVDIKVDAVAKGSDIKKGDTLPVTITCTMRNNNLITLDSGEEL